MEAWVRESVVKGCSLSIVLLGHGMFLYITRPASSNARFPFHIRTCQVVPAGVGQNHSYEPRTRTAAALFTVSQSTSSNDARSVRWTLANVLSDYSEIIAITWSGTNANVKALIALLHIFNKFIIFYMSQSETSVSRDFVLFTYKCDSYIHHFFKYIHTYILIYIITVASLLMILYNLVVTRKAWLDFIN